jgi:hypothetical protein
LSFSFQTDGAGSIPVGRSTFSLLKTVLISQSVAFGCRVQVVVPILLRIKNLRMMEPECGLAARRATAGPASRNVRARRSSRWRQRLGGDELIDVGLEVERDVKAIGGE